MKKNDFTASIRNKAREEATKDFAADWGGFWEVAGNWIGVYLLAGLGFVADFSVAFSMIYVTTRSTWGSALSALLFCGVIQYAFGGATFRITKAFKSGKIHEGRYARSSIVAGVFALTGLVVSVYFSIHSGSIIEAASEPQAAKELQDENAVNAYYDDKVAGLQQGYESERNTLQQQRAQLLQQKNGEGVTLWTSRRSVENIDTKQAPTLRNNYESSRTQLEQERAARLAYVVQGNQEVKAKWESRIVRGGVTIQWANILINLLRVILIMGYAVFLLDVYKDEETEQQAQQGPKSQYLPISGRGAVDIAAVAEIQRYAIPKKVDAEWDVTPPPVGERPAPVTPLQPVANSLQQVQQYPSPAIVQQHRRNITIEGPDGDRVKELYFVIGKLKRTISADESNLRKRNGVPATIQARLDRKRADLQDLTEELNAMLA